MLWIAGDMETCDLSNGLKTESFWCEPCVDHCGICYWERHWNLSVLLSSCELEGPLVNWHRNYKAEVRTAISGASPKKITIFS